MLRRAIRVSGFVGVTGAMLAAYSARLTFARRRGASAAQERYAIQDAWLGRWCDVMLRLFSIRVLLEREAGALPVRGGRLVIANHRSALDIAILLRAFGGHMVSRADLARWPLIGLGARAVGTLFVDRSSTASGAGVIRAMRERLEERHTVIVFPEGTTFKGDEVRPFHNGAFVAALRTNAEIVPVGIAYERGSGSEFVGESFAKHLSRMSAAPPSRVKVRVGAPIPVEAGDRAASLGARAHAEVQRLVHAARAGF